MENYKIKTDLVVVIPPSSLLRIQFFKSSFPRCARVGVVVLPQTQHRYCLLPAEFELLHKFSLRNVFWLCNHNRYDADSNESALRSTSGLHQTWWWLLKEIVTLVCQATDSVSGDKIRPLHDGRLSREFNSNTLSIGGCYKHALSATEVGCVSQLISLFWRERNLKPCCNCSQ